MLDPQLDVRQGDSQFKKQLAVEEILDVPGLSKLQAILKKYNLTSVVIDYNLNIRVKHSRGYNPGKGKEKSCLIQ